MTADEILSQKKGRVRCEFHAGLWANMAAVQCIINQGNYERCRDCEQGKAVKKANPGVNVGPGKYQWGNPYPASQVAARRQMKCDVDEIRSRGRIE